MGVSAWNLQIIFLECRLTSPYCFNLQGGDLNVIKYWHTQTLRNIEKVWKREQAANEEKKKTDQLKKELEEERSVEELKRMQAAAGGRKYLEKVDWMYASGPQGTGAVLADDREEFLLGRKKVDKLVETGTQVADVGSNAISPIRSSLTLASLLQLTNSTSTTHARTANSIYGSTANTLRDMQSKIRDDPLLMIKKREQNVIETTLANPLKVKELKEARERKEKKDKKEKKEKKDRKRRADSSDDDRGTRKRERSRSRSRDGDRKRQRSRSRSPIRRDDRDRDGRRSPPRARHSPDSGDSRGERPRDRRDRSRDRSPPRRDRSPPRRDDSDRRDWDRSPRRERSPRRDRSPRRERERSPPRRDRSPPRRDDRDRPNGHSNGNGHRPAPYNRPTPLHQQPSKPAVDPEIAKKKREAKLAQMMADANEMDSERAKRVEQQAADRVAAEARDAEERAKSLSKSSGFAGESGKDAAFLKGVREGLAGGSMSAAEMIQRRRNMNQKGSQRDDFL